jgi:type II secretory pathway component PulF
MFANLYSTGEVSGKLDDSLRRLYSHYNEEGTRKLYAFAQWTPKLVYFAVAGIIAYKVITFYNGLYGSGSELDQAIKGFGN